MNALVVLGPVALVAAKRRLPVSIPSAGPHLPPKSFYWPSAWAHPVVVLTQLVLTRPGAWAIMETKESAQNTRPVVSGKLSLSCDEETWRFVDQNNLSEAIMAYMMAADKCFKLVETPSCRLVQDPENDDQYLLADMHIQGETEDILGSEARFRRMILKLMPFDVLYRIRLSYHIK